MPPTDADIVADNLVVGHLLGAIDISRFLPLEEFYDRVDRLAEELRRSPRGEGIERVYVPGDIEAAQTERRLRDGIPVAEPTRQEFLELGRRLGIPFE